jgi:hypothetical protein
MNDSELFKDWFPEDRKPWEMMPGEPTKAYNAFLCYLQIQPSHERTIPLAAAIFYEKPLDYYKKGKGGYQVNPSFINWKNEWMWHARAAAYDFQTTRDRLDAIRDARIEKAREEGHDLARVESMMFHLMEEQYEKLATAITKLDIEKPTWRDINSAMKQMSELMVNFYKISKYKHDMKDDEFAGLSDKDMDQFWEKKPTKEQIVSDVSEMAEDSD